MRSEKQLFQKIDRILVENMGMYTFTLTSCGGHYRADLIEVVKHDVSPRLKSWPEIDQLTGINNISSSYGVTRRAALENLVKDLEENFGVKGENFTIGRKS